jgi:hypothetical protein
VRDAESNVALVMPMAQHSLSHHSLEALGGHALDHDSYQRIADIRVLVQRPRRHSEVGSHDGAAQVAVAVTVTQRSTWVVDETCRVHQELMNGDAPELRVRTDLRDVIGDRSMQVDAALLSQRNGGCCR